MNQADCPGYFFAAAAEIGEVRPGRAHSLIPSLRRSQSLTLTLTHSLTHSRCMSPCVLACLLSLPPALVSLFVLFHPVLLLCPLPFPTHPPPSQALTRSWDKQAYSVLSHKEIQQNDRRESC